MTRGERYVFVPFLYDDEGARLRRANLGRVDADLRGSRKERRAGRGR